MAEGFVEGAKSVGEAAKKNWLPAVVILAGIVILVLWYDHKHSGSLTTKVASLPVVGKLFA